MARKPSHDAISKLLRELDDRATGDAPMKAKVGKHAVAPRKKTKKSTGAKKKAKKKTSDANEKTPGTKKKASAKKGSRAGSRRT